MTESLQRVRIGSQMLEPVDHHAFLDMLEQSAQ
jgi:hypothetical protein